MLSTIIRGGLPAALPVAVSLLSGAAALEEGILGIAKDSGYRTGRVTGSAFAVPPGLLGAAAWAVMTVAFAATVRYFGLLAAGVLYAAMTVAPAPCRRPAPDV